MRCCMRMVFNARFLLCSFALFVCSGVHSPLQADWSKPITIAAPGFTDNAQVAINSKGEAIVVFAGSEVSNQDFQIEAATLKKGVPSTPHIFPLSNSVLANVPNVAINKHGNAAIAWIEFPLASGQSSQIVASSYLHGRWSNPTVLSNPETTSIPINNKIPGITIDSQGKGLAVWVELDNISSVFSIRASRLEKRKWKKAETIFNSTNGLSFPVLAGNSKGDVLIAWFNHNISTGSTVLQAAQFKDGVWHVKTFDDSNVFNITNIVPQPAVALNESGDGVIAWVDNTRAVQAVRLEDGEWHDIRTLSDLTLGTPAFLDVAIDNQGDAIAIWRIQSTLVADSNIVQASHHVHGSWQNPQTLIGPTINSLGKTLVQIDSDGNAVAVIQEENISFITQIEVRVLDRGRWGPFTLISDPTIAARAQDFAMNASGKAVAVWPSGTTGDQSIQASIGRFLFLKKGKNLNSSKLSVPFKE
jgi:hypothetical protein